MKIQSIYHSHSGITRGVAEEVKAACGNAAGGTLPILAEALAAKGMAARGEFVLTARDIRERERVKVLISTVKESGRAP